MGDARPQKITFGEMRSCVRGLLIYCSGYRCSHSIAISADPWPDHVRLSDLEPRFFCMACGKRGADVRRIFIGMGSRSQRWATTRCALVRRDGGERGGVGTRDV